MAEQPMNKNTVKQDSYSVAWAQMSKAIDAGFFLEAVAIQESMMFDRIRSFLEFVVQEEVKDETPFSRVLRRWEAELNADRKQLPPKWESEGDLPKRILDWIDARNVVVHKMVRSRPGTPTMPIDQFLALAKSAAEGGAILCREVSDWHRRQKTRSAALADQSVE
jgi:hypothetical protein